MMIRFLVPLSCAHAPRAASRALSTALPAALSSTGPEHPAAAAMAAMDALAEFCAGRGRLLTLTGAGVSTDSGIPDYRGANGSYKRGHKPVQHSEFVSELRHRQRYWARSMLGWRPFLAARPNRSHRALARLQAHGHLAGGLITQNVDGLHQRAGSQPVLDLHGRMDAVKCLDCGTMSARADFQARLELANPGWLDVDVLEIRADSDAQLGTLDYSSFAVPPCNVCGGSVKPDVVFFGGSIDEGVVGKSLAAADACDALLVVGSTCSTYSVRYLCDVYAHRRFCRPEARSILRSVKRQIDGQYT